MLYLKPSVSEDATFLGPRLREADKEELQADWGETPLSAIIDFGIKISDTCWTIHNEENPVAIFGNKQGSLWMVATPDLLKDSMEFLRESEGIIQQLQDTYGTLTAISHNKNTEHHRWLRWLDFSERGSVKECTLFVREPQGV